MVKISCKCPQEILLLDEKGTNETESSRKLLTFTGIQTNKVSATWTGNCKEPALENISLTMKPGQLIGVVGHVGSGKVGHHSPLNASKNEKAILH